MKENKIKQNYPLLIMLNSFQYSGLIFHLGHLREKNADF